MPPMTPQSDTALLAYADNFDAALIARFENVGLSIAQAEAFTAARAAYVAAFGVANEQATRTPVSIELKNEKKDALVKILRELIGQIQSFGGTTDADRRAFDITIRKDPSPIPAPGSAPVIIVESVTGNVINVRLKDATDPDRRGKPDGVATATLLYHVGPDAPTSIEGWTLQGTVSRVTASVEVAPTTPGGSKVWIIGYWSNAKGESGPPSTAVSTFTQFIEGGLSQLKIAA